MTEKERIEACIDNVCALVLNCKKEDLTDIQLKAMQSMYMLGTHTCGFKDPTCGMEYRWGINEMCNIK